MIGNDRFVQVFGSVPAGDDSKLVQIVANAVREGFHIVLCAPGTNQPVCTLPATKAKLEHKCGAAHVLSLESVLGEPDPFFTQTRGYNPKELAKVRAKVQAIINRVTKAHDGVKPNIGVVPGPSGYIAEIVTMADPLVTVRCSGIIELGYAWFTVPAGTPIDPLDLRPVLVPPSRVRLGPYEIIGQTSPAPAWLLERIAQS